MMIMMMMKIMISLKMTMVFHRRSNLSLPPIFILMRNKTALHISSNPSKSSKSVRLIFSFHSFSCYIRCRR